MDTVQSSAENTDHDESFEDATEVKNDSRTSPKTGSSSPEPSEEDEDSETPSSPVVSNENESNGGLHTVKTEEAEAKEESKHGSEPNIQPTVLTEVPSPTLSAHPIPVPVSNTESSHHKDDQSVVSAKSPTPSIEQPVMSPTTDPTKPTPRPSRFQGFSAALPSVPWGAPPKKSPDPRSPSPQPPAQSSIARKVSSFGWLGRSQSAPKETKDTRSPPLISTSSQEVRRNTQASLSTIGSNPDLMLKALEEGAETTNGQRVPTRASLKEKFKLLRMREEIGITSLDNPENKEGGALAGLIGRSATLGVGIASPTSVNDEEDGPQLPTKSPVSPGTENIPHTPVDPNLPPGTVAGVSSAPSDTTSPIDWDFWQTVVNEGPQAVARSSPEELGQAISSGIPQTIRGVIWQVLASSKNDDLEAVYHELCTRSTNTDREKPSQTPVANGQINGGAKEKESVASSRSSVRSNQSGAATSSNAGRVSPSPSHDAESVKAQAHLAAERAKKAKEDATALSKLEKMIKRDMGSRTSYSKYAVAAGFQEGLFNVCRAYALYDDAVGYPQGMNFIIMPLLFTMSEEEAFCLLVRLMNKYRVRELFINDMPGLHLHLYQFERLLEDLEPALYCHLNRRGVTPRLYATQWFLTLFAYRFPLQLVMRVYDLLLCEGLEGAILKFGMAVVQRNVSTLLGMNDMQVLTNFLKEKLFDVYIDATPSTKSILESGFFGSSGGSDNEIYRADLLVQDACAVKLTPEMLNKYRDEWEEKTRTEKARETELENLKTDTITKAAQIKSLEKRVERSDGEHIELANELIKMKVENQDLLDVNESLKGQVEELKKVAESEAKNVEDRMRAGTEQVMQRNIEVQNQNRNMEEQMAEMERELVEMKMKFAELNGEHEGLKQRWNDLRRALE